MNNLLGLFKELFEKGDPQTFAELSDIYKENDLSINNPKVYITYYLTDGVYYESPTNSISLFLSKREAIDYLISLTPGDFFGYFMHNS